MPHRLNPHHWATFAGIPFRPQGPFGRTPASWAAQHGIAPQGHALPDKVLTREEVLAECRDPAKSVLHGYVCAMAWGMQGAGPAVAHVARAWAHRASIEARLLALRSGRYGRRAGYDRFAIDPIPGLGPSFFTKLVHFFRPNDPVGYIMDQWTGKSVNLLTGQHVVRLGGESPTSANTGENYERFCRVIDFLAAQEGCTGVELEQRLFSQNAQHRRPRGPWRAHVHGCWMSARPVHRYDHAAMMAWVDAL